MPPVQFLDSGKNMRAKSVKSKEFFSHKLIILVITAKVNKTEQAGQKPRVEDHYFIKNLFPELLIKPCFKNFSENFWLRLISSRMMCTKVTFLINKKRLFPPYRELLQFPVYALNLNHKTILRNSP